MKLRTLALVATLLAGQPALAHHSFATFDLARELTLVGTIAKCNSPARTSGCRCWCRMRGGARPSGASRRARRACCCARVGRRPHSAGDRVTIVTHPARSGAPSGSLVRVTLADGRVFGPGGPPPPQPSRH